ncbi:MAG: Fe-S cluster domain-containing protein [Clostridia bacterium]|nr:Fe-S cluster domain-containing protein [Clostridia bacterium]
MREILIPIAIVGGTGLLFGCLLAFASIIFKVNKDTRIEMIEEILPGANCGACGYAGCSAYATAVVEDNAPVSSCSVGKDAVAKKIATIMGKKAEKVEPKVARVMCAGKCGIAEDKYKYVGIQSCSAAAKLAGGAKTCPNGCLGLGTCISVCKFDAIYIKGGIARIDETKCKACGMCLNACPKGLITLVPVSNKVWVPCNNTEKGANTNKYCKTGCIACRICEKNCPVEAISVIDNHAVVDYSKCVSCGVCADKCPKKLIHKSNTIGVGV